MKHIFFLITIQILTLTGALTHGAAFNLMNQSGQEVTIRIDKMNYSLQNRGMLWIDTGGKWGDRAQVKPFYIKYADGKEVTAMVNLDPLTLGGFFLVKADGQYTYNFSEER